tara:strand:+ start:440 stop:607 length:168 start_codon:yes stop_codon:yes gene_type:complete
MKQKREIKKYLDELCQDRDEHHWKTEPKTFPGFPSYTAVIAKIEVLEWVLEESKA